MNAKEYVQELVDRGHAAQKIFEEYSQEQVDAAVRAVGKVIYDHAEELARMAVDESGMGNYEDKIAKNRNKTKNCWYRLKGVKSRGIIRYIEDEGLLEIAKPIGVIAALCPTTNPTMTPAQNAMIALKGGNAIIVCPHPRSKNTTIKSVEYMRGALEELGAPVDLIQVAENPTMEVSGLAMQMCDTCVATGGPGVVKAAYSSGKPAFGVGAGNIQALIDRDVDMDAAVDMIVKGRCNDNGVLCTCEQSAICPAEKYDEMIAAMKKRGVYYVESEEEVEQVREKLFPNGVINKGAIGRPAVEIADLCGLTVPEDTKMLLIKVEKYGKEEVLAKEKLCVVQCAYRYDTWEDGVEIAYQNIMAEGTGHSMVLHSNNKEHIEYAAEKIPVSRFVVNQVGSSGIGGALNNGLLPTATLGTGSWGGNSLSGNLWWNHLVNISRLAYVIPNAKIPTDEEIWTA